MLGLRWAQLRPSWGQLGHTYAIMASTWHQLGLSWGHLAANLGHHEAMWGPTFAILKPPWASSGHLKSNFEPTSSNLCQLIPTRAILGPFFVADCFDDRVIDTSLLQLPCRPARFAVPRMCVPFPIQYLDSLWSSPSLFSCTPLPGRA